MDFEFGWRNLLTTLVCVVGSLVAVSPVAIAEKTAAVARIAGSGWVADAPTKVADALDYFNPPGSDEPRIRVDYYNSGREALHRLLQGEAEFALAATTPVAITLLNQARDGITPEIVILASVALSNQSHYIVANGDRGIATPADLIGKRIGLLPDSSAHFGWSRFALLHGIRDAAVSLIDVPIDQQASLLSRGEIDAAVTWDPWGLRMQDDLGKAARVFSTRHIHSENWLLVTRYALVRQHPALAERVVAGYRRAIALIDRDPEQARALHARISGIPAESLASLERGIFWSLGLNWSVLANMEAQFAWLGQRPEFAAVPLPHPAHYLAAGPLSRVAAERLMLPAYLYRNENGIAER